MPYSSLHQEITMLPKAKDSNPMTRLKPRVDPLRLTPLTTLGKQYLQTF